MNRRSLGLLAGVGLTLCTFAYVRAGSDLQGNSEATVFNSCPRNTVYLNPIASQVYIGQYVTLTWSSTDAASLSSNFGETELNGSKIQYLDSLGSHSFTVTSKSSCGDDATTTRTVNVVSPPPPPPPPPPYHRCFVAGTQISMADGTFKNVEDVKAGDTLKSFDVATGKYVLSKVTDRYKSEWDSFYQINGSNGVTGPHQFMANGQWTRVDQLKVGDKLVNEKGDPVEITSIVKRPGPVDIFPLFVENPPSDYFAEGVLVHNKDNEADPDEGLVAGTKVLMADGSRKAIELVREGEGLMSYYPKEQGMGTAKVMKVFPGKTTGEYIVINGKLAMGPKHRLVMQNRPKAAKDQKDQKK